MRPSALLFIILLSAFAAQAQWNTSGNNIYTTNTGNVGIGTTTPNSKLEIVGSNPRIKLFSTSGPPISRGVDLGADGSFESVLTQVSGVNTERIRIGSKNNFSFSLFSSDIDRLTIKPDGKIGIGTTTPAHALDVNGIINASAVYINGAPFAGGGSQWITSGSNIYFTSGNIGIGTFTPGVKLDVVGTGGSSIDLRVSGRIHSNSAEGGLWLSSSNDGFVGNAGSNIGFWTSGAGWNALQINKANGNVGLGTNSPAERLHINGSIRGNQSGAIRINTGSGYVDIGPMNTTWSHFQTDRAKFYFQKPITVDGGIVSSYDEDLNLQTSGTTRLTVRNTDGNVGIGTSSPAYKLDVNGAINATSILVNGAPLTGGSSQWTNSGSNIYFNTGNVGIGGSSSSARMDVTGPATGTGITIRASGGGDVVLNSGGSMFFDGNYSYSSGNYIRPVSSNTQAFFTAGAERLRITSGGNVGIGTTLASNPNNYRLAVNGRIGAKEVEVETVSTAWPDYVFDPSYNLLSLEEVELFIRNKKHLPEVPAASDIEKNGHNLGETDVILLKKIEELTLYLIEMNKKIAQQQEEIQLQRKEIQTLKRKL